jgi:ABC-type sugar transport system ATPase subunit
MMTVELDHLGKEFAGGIQAVRDLSLTISGGECLVLAGPSGCGKTTTLRLIAGLETPTTGSIRFDGQGVEQTPPWRRPVAMVFQRPALFPNRTVRQNITLGLPRTRGWFRGPSEQDRQRVAEVADVLGLSDVLERPAVSLSGGQQHRVALARALVRRAPLVLLDEPLGHLDAPLRVDLRRQLILLRRQFPATMIHVTHDSAEALAVADRLAVLAHGQMLQLGSPQELLDAPAHRFVARFLQDVSVVPGRLVVENDAWRFSAGDGHWRIPRIQWIANPRPDIEMGIREVRAGTDATGDAACEMTVQLVEEDAGAQRIVGRRGSIEVTARSKTRIRVGEKIVMRWNWANSWVFDAEGRTVGRVAPAG